MGARLGRRRAANDRARDTRRLAGGVARVPRSRERRTFVLCRQGHGEASGAPTHHGQWLAFDLKTLSALRLADIQQRKSELDAADAESRAEWAETDATIAIDYAYAAVEEAEYATLDAILARREAEELALAASR